MTSRPIPSAGINPILRDERAAVAMVLTGVRKAIFEYVCENERQHCLSANASLQVSWEKLKCFGLSSRDSGIFWTRQFTST
jgi:hypothetical protein